MDLNIPSVVVRLPGTPSATVVPIAGPPGNDGADGVDGAPGAPGAPGTNGTNGVDGSDGAAGSQGPPGNDGADGADGATGPQGLPGNDGADGADGAPGATGSQGPPGNDGADGADGATGPQGIPGTDGADGADGADVSTDYVNTTPAAPATGLVLFARHRARRLLASQGPEGLDTQYQPSLFSNRIVRLSAVPSSGTPSLDGWTAQNYGTSPTAVTPASTDFYTGMVRHRLTTAATANASNGMRSTAAQWFASSLANAGGAFMVARFGLNVVPATGRVFIGLSASAANLTLTSTEPSALTNLFGFAADSADTTFQFIHNDGSGAATKIDLGSSFPCDVGATYFYEFRIFVPSGAGNKVLWSAHRLNDGIVVQGGPITTNLPAVGTMLNTHWALANGATASAMSMDVQSIYVESDN